MTLQRMALLGAGSIFDPDAAVYIAAVEAADGIGLEAGVKQAIDNFVIGCKADGIWTAIKACCILAGARTLAGALVPLVGPAPTNRNFANSDYNRKTGLIGDGSSKDINTNALGTVIQQNNAHVSLYVSSSSTISTCSDINCNAGTSTNMGRDTGSPPNTWVINDSGSGVPRFTDAGTGFKGLSRNSSASFNRRSQAVTTNVTRTSSGTPNSSSSFFVFSLNGVSYSNARISFYSIGTFLDIAILDSRVTTLVNALAAAIP